MVIPWFHGTNTINGFPYYMHNFTLLRENINRWANDIERIWSKKQNEQVEYDDILKLTYESMYTQLDCRRS